MNFAWRAVLLEFMMSYHFLVRVSDLSDVTSFLNKERLVNTFDMFMCKAFVHMQDTLTF